MRKQVFLGGACGSTTWRREIAIPALEAVGISYFDPQLCVGEWTEACEAGEMKAKADADVLLFVISGQTRGVASIAEVAYFIAAGRPLALTVTDVPNEASIDGQFVGMMEKYDLNRGRIFVRTMAACHGVPVFDEVGDAVHYAIELAKRSTTTLTLSEVRTVLADVSSNGHEFLVEPMEDGFLLQLCGEAEDINTGVRCVQRGRKWHIDLGASRSEIVQTAFKAVVTWQEHEAREHFRYRGVQVFGPHFNVDRFVSFCRSTPREQAARTEAEK